MSSRDRLRAEFNAEVPRGYDEIDAVDERDCADLDVLHRIGAINAAIMRDKAAIIVAIGETGVARTAVRAADVPDLGAAVTPIRDRLVNAGAEHASALGLREPERDEREDRDNDDEELSFGRVQALCGTRCSAATGSLGAAAHPDVPDAEEQVLRMPCMCGAVHVDRRNVSNGHDCEPQGKRDRDCDDAAHTVAA